MIVNRDTAMLAVQDPQGNVCKTIEISPGPGGPPGAYGGGADGPPVQDGWDRLYLCAGQGGGGAGFEPTGCGN